MHLQAATLFDANKVLQAANQAGFRESGALNLSPSSEDGSTCPAVAIRSMGLGFDSIIGAMDSDGSATSFVDEAQLNLLVSVANNRFIQNTQRTERFRSNLMRLFKALEPTGTEDEQSRRERKKEEGLKRQLELQNRRIDTHKGKAYKFGDNTFPHSLFGED